MAAPSREKRLAPSPQLCRRLFKDSLPESIELDEML
jgi:hypothetical protein